MLRSAETRFETGREAALAALRKAEVAASDETGVRIEGSNSFHCVFRCEQAVVHHAAPTRGACVVHEIMDGHRPAVRLSDCEIARNSDSGALLVQPCRNAARRRLAVDQAPMTMLSSGVSTTRDRNRAWSVTLPGRIATPECSPRRTAPKVRQSRHWARTYGPPRRQVASAVRPEQSAADHVAKLVLNLELPHPATQSCERHISCDRNTEGTFQGAGAIRREFPAVASRKLAFLALRADVSTPV